ncbi:MAG: winged helix-turn-helix domain-containing protein [Burkholderiales bacterium]|nr:winged helix-turn-helix domain-containing protein [Burkholderiales bacterium]
MDTHARRVLRDGEPVPLEPRAVDLLVYLLRHRHRVVPKSELLDQVWRGAAGAGGSLPRAVMMIRQALEPDPGADAIRTSPRVGYRFAAAVAEDTQPGGAPPTARPTLAVLPLDNATGDTALDWVELGLMSLAMRHLDTHPGVQPVAVASVLLATQGAHGQGPQAQAEAVRRATGARVVVTGRVQRRAAAGWRLQWTARDDEATWHGHVDAARPAELAAGLAREVTQAVCPDAPPGTAMAEPADPWAEEVFARALQALATHRWERAAHLLRLAHHLVPDHRPVLLELMRALSNVGDLALEPLATAQIERAEREGDVMLAAHAHQALGRMYLNRSELARAELHLARSLTLGDGHASADWVARTLMLQASCAVIALDPTRARAIARRMVECCEDSGDRILRVGGLNIEAIAIASAGQLEHGLALSVEAARRARELHATSYLVDACDNAAWYAARLARLAEAASYAEEAVGAALGVGHLTHAWMSAPVLCWISLVARTPEVAADAVARLPDPAGIYAPEQVWRVHGLLALVQGRARDAADLLRRAVQVHRAAAQVQDESQALPWLVDALVLSGALDEAQAELEAADAPQLARDADLRAQARHGRALLAHARGDLPGARRLLAELVAGDAAPLWQALARIDLAWLHAEAGETADARRLLAGVAPALATHPLVRATSERIARAASAASAADPPLPLLRSRL